MEFCGIRTFLKRILDNETQPDDDFNAFFARLHKEIPFYIAYRFFPELRNADCTVDELLSEDRVSVGSLPFYIALTDSAHTAA